MFLTKLLGPNIFPNIKMIAICLAVIIVLLGVVKYTNAITKLNEYSVQLDHARAESQMRTKELADLNRQLALVNEVSKSFRLANEKQQERSDRIIVKHANDKDDYMSEALINILNEVDKKDDSESSN